MCIHALNASGTRRFALLFQRSGSILLFFPVITIIIIAPSSLNHIIIIIIIARAVFVISGVSKQETNQTPPLPI